jgi:hypothetical protein
LSEKKHRQWLQRENPRSSALYHPFPNPAIFAS